MLERRISQDLLTNKFVEVLATKYLKPYENVVRATANTATDSYTIYLPPVSQMAGKMVSILAYIANSKAVTVADLDDSENWADDTLDTDKDKCLYISDGKTWHKASKIA